MEILEEIKEQEAVEMGSIRESVVCVGKVSKDINNENDNQNNPKCTIFLTKGEINCPAGDYVALSPTNAHSVFRERQYIMEVKSCAGKHLYVDPVWPRHDDVPNKLSSYPAWKIMLFPNLVSFNRMLEALRKLCTCKDLQSAGIFGELLNTWNVTGKDSEVTGSENRPSGSKECIERTESQAGVLAVSSALFNANFPKDDWYA